MKGIEKSIAAVALLMCAPALVIPSMFAADATTKSAVDPEGDGFYCDRLALNAEQKAKIRELGKTLRDSAEAVAELPDGFEFRLSGGVKTFETLAAYVPLERACCPFFNFEVRLDNSGDLRWRLTGATGVKRFIREELSWLFAKLEQ